MTTPARDIVSDALEIAGVGSVELPPEGAYVTRGLRALNDMMSGFKSRGHDVEHVPLSSGDNIALGDEYVEHLKYALAKRLAPVFQKPGLTGEALRLAEHGENVLNGNLSEVPEVTVPGDVFFTRRYFF